MAIAAILAGGQARRMHGRDKSTLTIGGRTILSRQLDALRPVVAAVFVVGAPPERALPAGVQRIGDRTSGAGPLGGLDAAFEAAAGEDVLLLACDMPHVTADFARYLIEAATPGTWNAVVPRTDRGYHPLCAVYSTSSRDAVRRRLAAGTLRMIELVESLNVRVIEGTELARFGEASHLLANVNTPADVSALDALNH